MQFLTHREARNLIVSQAGGTIFSVIFKKRTNGKLRRMTCRLHVRAHLVGGVPTISEARWQRDHRCRLLTVFDMNKRENGKQGAYRCISLDAVLWVRIKGIEYKTTTAEIDIEKIKAECGVDK